ncbi:MAG: helix-hairpin-helix domain-containing protein [Pseudomonadota bacterium]
MLKKLLSVVALFIASIGFAFAQVDVNKADQAALDSVKGIGPAISKTILDERKKGGDFKDWPDFENRVKGIGEKNSAKLSQAGLTVNGQAKSNAPGTKTTTKETKSKADVVKTDAAKEVPPAETKETKKNAKKDEVKK